MGSIKVTIIIINIEIHFNEKVSVSEPKEEPRMDNSEIWTTPGTRQRMRTKKQGKD